MAAALHPEAQARVQAQLDKVVGRERGPRLALFNARIDCLLSLTVPTFDDEESLPEVTAFFLEAARWRPQIPAGQSVLVFECLEECQLLAPVRQASHIGRRRTSYGYVWASPYTAHHVSPPLQKDYVIPTGTEIFGLHLYAPTCS